MSNKKTEYYSCRKALPVLLRYRLSLLKYFFWKKKYPLFFVRSLKGGLLASNRMQKKLKLCKFVKHNGSFYFSLTVPHWPSKAFDNMVANGGLNITMAGTTAKKQIDTAILGITRKCSYSCSHCYERFNLSDTDTVPMTIWKSVVNELQNTGVSVITFSGGEPMMRYEGLLELLKSSDHNLSDFHIHTSGYGVTPERAAELKIAGLDAAGVGLDDYDPIRNDKLRGFKGAHEQAVNAIKYFNEAGIFTYVNTCPTRELIRSGDICKFFETLKELNVGIVRWLEPKPCGGYLDENPYALITSDDRKILTEFYTQANTGSEFSNYPLIHYEAFSEAPENMGCMMAGNSLIYIDSLGNVEPCVFLPVSFGNVLQENFPDILKKMRAIIPTPIHKVCPSIQLGSKIKIKKESGNIYPIPYEEFSEELNELLS